MFDLKPNQYVIKNGKLQPKEIENDQINSRVVPYNHTVRLSCEDYYHNTLMEYKRQIQGLRRNYGELQNSYWQLLGSSQKQDTITSSQVSPNIHESMLKDNETMIESSDVCQSIIMDPLDSSRKHMMSLGNSVMQFRSPLKKATMCESMMMERARTTEAENPEEQFKEVLQEMKRLKIQLEETKKKLNSDDDDMKKFYEENMKKMQDILERERKHTKILNGVISRMRGEMESKDNILKYILNTKNIDKGTVQKMAKGMKLKL